MIEILAVVSSVALLGLALRWEIRRRKLQSARDYIAAYCLGAKHNGDEFVVVDPR